jgi:YidC/Oxa1 family membrane protein insertase
MDKKSILAIVIITVIILLLPTYYKLINSGAPPPSLKPENQSPAMVTDTTKTMAAPVPADTGVGRKQPAAQKEESKEPVAQAKVESLAEEKIIDIETPLIYAKISNQGGGRIYDYYLKKYQNWDKAPVKIIDEAMRNGFDFQFLSAQGNRVQLNQFFFFPEIDRQKVSIDENGSITLNYYMIYNGVRIEKRIIFYGNRYHVDLQFKVSDPESLFLNREYQLTWKNGLPSNEINQVEDYSYSEIYASMGDELENSSITSEGEVPDKSVKGLCSWLAVRTKYFTVALIPRNVQTSSVTFGGRGLKINNVLERLYTTSLNVIKNEQSKTDSFTVYLGPLDNSVLGDYHIGLNKLVLNHGWYERTFRVISLPIVALLKFFYLFVPNYGLVIIIFSILVKILVYPLTKKSYRSMKEMSKLQPLLLELKEKYKGDPQRYQRETMKLYKEHGVNPLGGCLPILLQLPLLAALFIVFRSTIQLRGASFIPGWISDLSRADTIFHLPFSLPMYGNQFNILPILMTGSMIIQSKMTMQDPKQKAMVYIMPIFMLLLFNQFPSGLNLYYTLFNVLTILQQKFIDNKGR